jgi:nucleoside-diphosphate-sugar epimerase
MATTANRVLVTGAAGFLGGHCLAPLVERGFSVLTPYTDRMPQVVPGVQWVRGDVMDCVEAVTPCERTGAANDGQRRTFLANCSVSGLSGSSGRAFFIYGLRENPARMVLSVIIALLKGPPAKSSHGLQVGDYLHIRDVTTEVVALFDSQARGAYNIAAGTPTTIHAIVELLGEITGRSNLLRIGALPTRANDAPLVLGDGRRTLNDTGWKPRLTLVAGLAATVDWWRAHLNSRKG